MRRPAARPFACLLTASCLLASPSRTAAQVIPPPMAITVNSNTNSIQFIDPATQLASAPLLAGQLGGAGIQVFDVVVTPDGRTAIVSSFEAKRLFFIDISGGFSVVPTILGSTQVGVFPIDLARSPDGKFVIASGSGIDTAVSVVNVATRTLVSNVPVPGGKAQAVAIAPDGRTVVVVDYDGKVHLFAFDPVTGALTFLSTIRLNEPGTWPPGVTLPDNWNGSVLPFKAVNTAISPDGGTAIVVDGQHNQAAVLVRGDDGSYVLQQFVAPLNASRADEVAGVVTHEGQSVAFSRDGRTAYYLTTTPGTGTRVSILQTNIGVAAPGTSVLVTPARGTSQLFGVDTVAVDPSGGFIYVSNPTVSGGVSSISVVDLAVNAEANHVATGGIPTGIEFSTILDEAAITAEPNAATFVSVSGGPPPQPQQVAVSNTGMGSFIWAAICDVFWLTSTRAAGTDRTTVTLTVDPTGVPVGTHTGHLTITGNAVNSPQVIPVTLKVLPPGSQSPPNWTTPLLGFGSSIIRVVHITELRAAINERRAALGLPLFGWTDPTLTEGATIRAVHLTELRAALVMPYATKGLPTPSYTNPTIVPNTTVVKAMHILELRKAVSELY